MKHAYVFIQMLTQMGKFSKKSGRGSSGSRTRMETQLTWSVAALSWLGNTGGIPVHPGSVDAGDPVSTRHSMCFLCCFCIEMCRFWTACWLSLGPRHSHLRGIQQQYCWWSDGHLIPHAKQTHVHSPCSGPRCRSAYNISIPWTNQELFGRAI